MRRLLGPLQITMFHSLTPSGFGEKIDVQLPKSQHHHLSYRGHSFKISFSPDPALRRVKAESSGAGADFTVPEPEPQMC